MADAPTIISRRLTIAEGATGHKFRDRELLVRALTHPSAVEAKDPGAYYERLEFLGDSIIGFVVAEEVFHRFPAMPEGGMTRIKISVVAGSTLAEVAAELGLGEAIFVGESERGTGGRGLVSALENVYEALAAALYLDAGFVKVRDWILSTLGPRISEETAHSPENPKSLLQEIVQARGLAPRYALVGEAGPPHARMFTCAVEIDGTVVGEGSGRTKKEAEAAAASAALQKL